MLIGGIARKVIWVSIALSVLPPSRAENIEFPPNAGHWNVRERGAKGDGVTDDTEVLKKILASVKNHYQVVYFPNGTYLISDTLSWPARIVIQGQSEAGTIIRLKDNCPGFGEGASKPVLRCYYSNNESFGNYICNLTVDTGRGNPGAIGIRYCTHNDGWLERVTVKSSDRKGRIGIDMSETEFGPGMLMRVTVEGFDIGIKTPGLPSNAVLANITLKRQNVVGLENHLPVSIWGLVSDNAVPAVRNGGGALAQLILLDAKLSGGSSDRFAIENESACVYLRNISSSGYRAALRDRGNVIEGHSLSEYVKGPIHSAFGSEGRHLKLPILEPPETFEEPTTAWVEPSTAEELQAAIDSGARTIFFPRGRTIRIRDTLRIRGNVRRILCMRWSGIAANPADFGPDKPLLRIEGSGPPLTIEHISIGTGQNMWAWPMPKVYAVELASNRTVYLKGTFGIQGEIRNTPQATGRLFIDEAAQDMRFLYPQEVWIRQCNIENNPFDPKNPRLPRTYIANRGGRLWILGFKTESPAVHVVTTDGGMTEVLGGFFRDHFGPNEYSWRGEPPVEGLSMTSGVPFFVTKDASISASYVNYAWAPGKSRTLQGIEVRSGVTKDLSASVYAMGLYASILPGAEAPKPLIRTQEAAAKTPQVPTQAKPANRSDEKTLSLWDKRLADRLRLVLKTGNEISFFLGMARNRVKLLGLDDSGALRVSLRGLEMVVRWETLTLPDKRSLATALAGLGGPESHALAAFYALAQGDEEGAFEHLGHAGELAAEVRGLFAETP